MLFSGFSREGVYYGIFDKNYSFDSIVVYESTRSTYCKNSTVQLLVINSDTL